MCQKGEKKIQRAMMQYPEPGDRGLVLEGLRMAGRSDLIGSGKKCLVAGESRRKGVTETAS